MNDAPRVELRRADAGDVELLTRLYRNFLDSQFALMPGVPRNPDFDARDLVAFRLRDPDTFVWLAFVDGVAAGFSDLAMRTTGAAPPRSLIARARHAAAVLVGRNVPVYIGYRRVGHLLNLWVEPPMRGMKLGERLTRCRVDAARELGAEFIIGEVLADNAASHRTVTATGATAWATIYRWPTQRS